MPIIFCHTLTYSLVVWQTAILALADKSSNNFLSYTHLQPCGLADGTPRTFRQKFQLSSVTHSPAASRSGRRHSSHWQTKVPIIFCHTLTNGLVGRQTALLALADKSSNNLLSLFPIATVKLLKQPGLSRFLFRSILQNMCLNLTQA